MVSRLTIILLSITLWFCSQPVMVSRLTIILLSITLWLCSQPVMVSRLTIILLDITLWLCSQPVMVSRLTIILLNITVTNGFGYFYNVASLPCYIHCSRLLQLGYVAIAPANTDTLHSRVDCSFHINVGVSYKNAF